MKIWWLTKAWPWLQKNWQWVLLPIGILLTLGRLFLRTKLESVSAESLEAAQTKQDANTKAEEKAQEAKAELVEEIKEVKAEHKEAVAEQVEKLTKQTEELRKDPKALNAHLLDIGKKMRQ